jgi:hypothetical protein
VVHNGRRDSIVIDTNQLLLLIAYESLQHTQKSALERASTLYAVRGRGRDVPPEQFEQLWLVFQNARRRVIGFGRFRRNDTESGRQLPNYSIEIMSKNEPVRLASYIRTRATVRFFRLSVRLMRA